MHNCEKELRQYVNSVNLDQYVRFVGAVQNVEEYLQAADVFVFPTENDAFPSSIVEAMASGLPVLTTPVGAIKTIVTHRETGIMIQPGGFKQLFEALDVMLSDRVEALRLRQPARKSVEDLYAREISTQKMLLMFEELLSRPGTTRDMI